MERFFAELDKYNAATQPDTRHHIEEHVWDAFGAVKAPLVLDMSGFSALTTRYGILHYLGMVRRLQVALKPIVDRTGGQIVKFEADNLFALYDDVEPAIRAAIQMNMSLEAMNTMTDDTRDIHVSIGIAYGKMLLIPEKDFYGDPVNLASKLGEDIAGRGEILVTEAAFQRVRPEAGIQSEKLELSISGITIPAHKVKY
jgi:adenylate cyclase